MESSKDSSEVEGSLESSKVKNQPSLKFSFVPLQGEKEKQVVFKIPERPDIKSAINYLENKNASLSETTSNGIFSSLFGASRLPSGKCLKVNESSQSFV